jgi:hypothetical protein
VLIADQYLLTLRTVADAQAARSHPERTARAFNMAARRKDVAGMCRRDDPVNISVALQIVLKGERVPYDP